MQWPRTSMSVAREKSNQGHSQPPLIGIILKRLRTTRDITVSQHNSGSSNKLKYYTRYYIFKQEQPFNQSLLLPVYLLLPACPLEIDLTKAFLKPGTLFTCANQPIGLSHFLQARSSFIAQRHLLLNEAWHYF